MEKLKCCGKEMEVFVETSRFFEMHCGECNDVVYVKKSDLVAPQMVDD